MIYKIVFILLLIANVCLAKSIPSAKEESDILAGCIVLWSRMICNYSYECCSGGYCNQGRQCVPSPGR